MKLTPDAYVWYSCVPSCTKRVLVQPNWHAAPTVASIVYMHVSRRLRQWLLQGQMHLASEDNEYNQVGLLRPTVTYFVYMHVSRPAG
jgi:hypothetical protein